MGISGRSTPSCTARQRDGERGSSIGIGWGSDPSATICPRFSSGSRRRSGRGSSSAIARQSPRRGGSSRRRPSSKSCSTRSSGRATPTASSGRPWRWCRTALRGDSRSSPRWSAGSRRSTRRGQRESRDDGGDTGGGSMTIGLADRILQNDVSTFVAALDQAAFHEELERLCVSEWRCGAPRDVHVEPVRAHRNRCTLEIALTTVSGPRRLIGKVYADDRSDAFRAMRAVRRAGFGPDSAFSVARPLAWLPVLGVRLEEKVEGPSVKDIILTGGSAEWTAAAERCGTWLARFHCLAPTPQTGSDLLAALAHSREAVTRMTGLRPKAEALLRRL